MKMTRVTKYQFPISMLYSHYHRRYHCVIQYMELEMIKLEETMIGYSLFLNDSLGQIVKTRKTVGQRRRYFHSVNDLLELRLLKKSMYQSHSV